MCLIIPLTFPAAQNFFYGPDDWYIITTPGSITAITENNFSIFFATENGVYHFDKIREDFEYDFHLSNQLNYSRLYHFYYDQFRDYYWAVHQDGLSYKSSVSSVWREISLLNSGIYSYMAIDDIGASPEYFWIKSNEILYPFEPFLGKLADWDEAEIESELIHWGFSRYGEAGKNIPISEYTMEGEWNIGFHDITHKGDRQRIVPTLMMEDDEGNIWFGTDGGYLLKGWRHSTRLELITIGLPFQNITSAYQDDTGSWWFADSYFKRKGKVQYKDNSESSNPFLSRWMESDNQWTHYLPNESIVISNTDINSILKVGETMYFGTMVGLLYLDLIDKDWNLIDGTKGLNDPAVWDMVVYDGSLFLATARGINEISTVNQALIPDKNKKFEPLSSLQIYDLEMDSTDLYLATDAGLLKMNWEDESIAALSKKIFSKIKIDKNEIIASDGTFCRLGPDKSEKYITSYSNEFAFYENYIWTIDNNIAVLLDTTSSQTWDYSQEDGIPGNRIYGVDCDENWVWFLTNKGVAFYNWGRFHHAKN